MADSFSIAIFDILRTITDTVDLVSREISNHHYQVSYVALELGRHLGLEEEELEELVYAGLIHDVGAISDSERFSLLDFDLEDGIHHAEAGYWLLKDFEPLLRVAEIIRFHHQHWEEGKGQTNKDREVPFRSHILHLADRIAILSNTDKNILVYKDKIEKKIEDNSGSLFVPDLVDTFKELACREDFWLNLNSRRIDDIIRRELDFKCHRLDLTELLRLGRIFQKIIDYRSPFTAGHSAGVAATAAGLAETQNLSPEKCGLLKFAGFVHDLGKLAIPSSILEKPGALTREEFTVMRSHTYYTHRSLSYLPVTENICCWAAYHHERIDGTGYPFRVSGSELDSESRLMAVADVFTALTEDRPYREAMPPEKSQKIIRKMSENGKLDSKYTEILFDNYDDISYARSLAQQEARFEYSEFEKKMFGEL